MHKLPGIPYEGRQFFSLYFGDVHEKRALMFVKNAARESYYYYYHYYYYYYYCYDFQLFL